MPLTTRLGAMLLLAQVTQASSTNSWVGAWGFPPTSFIPTKVLTATTAEQPAEFDNVTVRQIVRLSHGGERLRVKLSNEFGATALRVGGIHVALLDFEGATVPGSDHLLTFAGRPSVSIPAGAPLQTDSLDWRLPALTRLAVSIYLPDPTTPPAHRVSEYVSSSGNFADATQLPDSRLVRTGALVSEIDVGTNRTTHVLVTLGDSITEGFGGTINGFRGWSDRLADRLSGNRKTAAWAVVNAGINSNRLLHNGPGTGALARFDRDVLAVPGVTAVILLEGINDIGYGHTVPSEAITAEDLIAGYRQLIERAHAHGLALIMATIPPYEGSHYFVPEGEAMRQTINQWIRSSGAADGVVDFDAVLRDPDSPTRVNPLLERGDHLHPNDTGYAAMASAIDLDRLLKISRGYRQ